MEEMSWSDWFVSFYTRDYGPTLDEAMESCVIPLMLKLRLQYFTLIGVNILYNFMLRLHRWPESVFHFIASAFGVSLICRFVSEDDLMFHFFFLIMGFLFLNLAYHFRQLVRINTVYVTQIGCVCFIIYSEIWHKKTDFWLTSRGFLMIAVMKIISLSCEINKGVEAPSFMPYSGYLLCPANSIFGPWIKYEEYIVLRSKSRHTSLNIKWIVKMVNVMTVATFHANLSHCYAYYFIPQDCTRWPIAYRKAFSYRTNHYFQSYFSECSMIAAGFNKLSDDFLGRWAYRITNPAEIEYPTFYAGGIYSWNAPLLRFLKLNIYDTVAPKGKKFATLAMLFATYLLHGINGEVFFVLFSFGGFAYFQSFSQRMISYYMNVCIKFRPCIRCTHKYTRYHPCSLAGNLLFIFINAFYLINMGYLVDMLSARTSIYETFNTWRNIDLTAYCVFSITYAFISFFINLIRM